jgi:hypothetical protein
VADDTLAILSEAEARLAINLTTGHQDEIVRMVTAVSRRIDDLCGPVVVRTVTDELLDANGPDLRPRYQPVYSVTAVTEYLSGTGTVVTAESISASGGYLLRDGILTRRSGFTSRNWNGRVKVTYVAGRYATTADVDAKFKVAAGAILRRLWTREAGAWARGGDPFDSASVGFFKAVEPMIDEFLGDERRMPSIA